ncbi:acyl carrier protein [Chloroflexota bacterium]
MTEGGTLAQVMDIIRGVVDLDHHVVGQTAIEQIEGWDSLASVNILLSLEETFDIELPQEDFFGAESIDDIVALLEECLRRG